jgi:integrase
MRYNLKLDDRENQKRKNGFPVAVFLSHKAKNKKVNLGLFFEKSEWDFKKQLPSKDVNAAILIRKKILALENILLDIASGKNYTLDQVKDLLLGSAKFINTASFLDFYEVFVAEKMAAGKISTALGYENALNSLKVYRTSVSFTDLSYQFLNGFKAWREKEGNSKSTIHTYLRKYRAVYNEAVKRGVIIDKKPFAGAFAGITVKANRTKKRNLTKASILKLERAKNLTMYHQRAVDLFLLMFYFGGQDLKDIYYLEHKKINNNRVYFMRGKLAGTGYEFDLKIVAKAQKIIDKYKVKGKYVFPWRKDFEGYRSFRNNLRRSLDFVQSQEKIEVLPLGGFIRIKVARHTFATIGKQLFVETDLLRELMGHERNDVDTIYKDKYPENVRDLAHEKIID